MWAAAAAIGWHRRRDEMVVGVERLVWSRVRRRGRTFIHKGLEPEDVVQECIIAVMHAAAMYDPNRIPITEWPIYAIFVAERRIFGLLKKQRKRQVWQQDEGQGLLKAAKDSPDPISLNEVMIAFEKLSPKDREVLRLRFKEDLTLQAIGDKLGITREAVRRRQEKALHSLTILLGEEPHDL